jgi:hypothetical protein
MQHFNCGQRIYANQLARPDDIARWRLEGQPVMSFPQGALRLENGLADEQGQAANYLLWCPEVFPANICARWQFRPLAEPGLAMLT